MSRSPRNPQTLVLLKFLEDLGFRTRPDDDEWVAERTSGLMKRWFVLPDDPSVESELVRGSFWRQGAEMRDELEAALEEYRQQVREISDG